MATIQIWIKKCPQQRPTLQQLIASLEIQVAEWVRRATISGTAGRTPMRSGHSYCQVVSALLWKAAFISTVSGQKRKSFIAFKASRITCCAPLCETGGRYKTAFIVYFEKLNSCKWVILVCFNFVSSFPCQYPMCISSQWWMNESVPIICMMNWIQLYFTKFSLMQGLYGSVQMMGFLSQVGGYKSLWALLGLGEVNEMRQNVPKRAENFG